MIGIASLVRMGKRMVEENCATALCLREMITILMREENCTAILLRGNDHPKCGSV
jgi:hypothetical protein